VTVDALEKQPLLMPGRGVALGGPGGEHTTDTLSELVRLAHDPSL
jgi:hypothetical protein